MKKIFTTLLVSVVVLVGAQAQNLKIHFADGTVQVHSVAAIDSITFEDLADPAPAIAFTETDDNLHITPNGDFLYIYWEYGKDEIEEFGSAEAALLDYVNSMGADIIYEAYSGEEVIEGVYSGYFGPGEWVIAAAGIDESGNLTTDVFTHTVVIPESGDPVE